MSTTSGLELQRWATNEVREVNLGDVRLNNRLIGLIDKLSSKPEDSIPSNCNSWNETKAAYRFFDNEKVTPEKILEPHYNATLARIKAEKVVLCLQDTTDIDFSYRKTIDGLGYTGNTSQPHLRGLFYHPTIAVTPDRLCLGVLQSQMWTREKKPIAKGKKPRKANIAEKESNKWLKSFAEVKKLAAQSPDTVLVSVSDRESDIYEFFLEHDNDIANAHFIVRNNWDRKVADSNKRIYEELRNKGSLGEIEFVLPEGRGRKSRHVTQEIRCATVELSPPTTVKSKTNIQMNIVMASEVNTPVGEEPIEWLLLTSLDVGSFADAELIIDYYLCRWQIELYFKVIKSGCKLEQLQLENINRIQNCFAIYMIIAWRIMFTTMLGRVTPDMSCDKVYSDNEWKAIYIILRRAPPPATPPTLNEMNKMIAQFGGFLNRRGDGEPGVKTMWMGLQRMRDFALSAEAWQQMNSHTYG